MTLWSYLSTVSLNIPLMVVGDFNIVTSQEEEMGGYPINLNDAAEFVQMIQQLSRIDLGYDGSKYTWSNNRLRGVAITERLDRAMGNNKWIAHVISKVEHLNRFCFDHSPLLISLSSSTSQGVNFRFINAWSIHSQFMHLVMEVQDTSVDGRPMVRFANKLKIVKMLQAQNNEIFGKIGHRATNAEDKVLEMEAIFDRDLLEINKIALCMDKTELDDRLLTEDLVWRQKANIKGIKEGDLNTRFSHQSVKKKDRDCTYTRLKEPMDK